MVAHMEARNRWRDCNNQAKCRWYVWEVSEQSNEGQESYEIGVQSSNGGRFGDFRVLIQYLDSFLVVEILATIKELLKISQ